MISVFYYDRDTYDIEECREMFESIKKVLPEDTELLAIPKECKFYEDFPLDMVIYLRDQINEIIEREEAKQNDL